MNVLAATLVEPGRYELREYPLPEPRPGCVLVKMDMSGICGTDKHTYQGYTTQYSGAGEGKKIPFPIIQGHENVGTVAAIGGDASTTTSRASRSKPVTASWSARMFVAASVTTAPTISPTISART